MHPGDWRLHHLSLPDGPGDFTPVRRDVHQEEHGSALDVVLDLLAGLVPGCTNWQQQRETEGNAE